MGCVSSCFRVEDIDEYMNPSSSVYRNCPCIRCLAHNFLNLVRLFALLLPVDDAFLWLISQVFLVETIFTLIFNLI